jgi:IS5 family transposase
MMFKALIVQHFYNISDDELEYQTWDRYSFCRFLGLLPEDRVPDAKTILKHPGFLGGSFA